MLKRASDAIDAFVTMDTNLAHEEGRLDQTSGQMIHRSLANIQREAGV